MTAPYRRSSKLVAAGLIVAACWVGSAAASSANISRAYETKSKVTLGDLVSLDTANSSVVVPANTDNGSRLVGVALKSSDSLLAVNPGDQGTVQVATSGTVSALVSDLSGDIKVGDQISASPFSGIGSKAPAGSRIIGLAQSTLTDHTKGVKQVTVTTQSGNTRQIYVGFIKINIGIGTATTAGGQAEVNTLQKLGRSLTGHTISTTRVVISMVIAALAMAAIITLIYASIFSGIISVGRNPLAKNSILRSVTIVLGMSIVMGLVATLTLFLILR
jgi:hypothetical protein